MRPGAFLKHRKHKSKAQGWGKPCAGRPIKARPEQKIAWGEENYKNFKKTVDKSRLIVYYISRRRARHKMRCGAPAREHSSAGRASALQAEGHRFEPCCSHQFHHGAVVQSVRMPACHAGGRGFEPLPRRHFALVAQSVEQETENLRVGGSIPPQGTICGSSSVVECHLAKVDVASPNLVYRSIWRHSQVVRQSSAKASFSSSSLDGASTSKHEAPVMMAGAFCIVKWVCAEAFIWNANLRLKWFLLPFYSKRAKRSRCLKRSPENRKPCPGGMMMRAFRIFFVPASVLASR